MIVPSANVVQPGSVKIADCCFWATRGATGNQAGMTQAGMTWSAGYDGRLRLWANGLAFSRSVIRIGVPGSSKNSRSELTR
jgi:hypothetical protein